MMGGSNATEGAVLKPVGPAWRVGKAVQAVQKCGMSPSRADRQEKRGSCLNLLSRQLPRTADGHAWKVISPSKQATTRKFGQIPHANSRAYKVTLQQNQKTDCYEKF